MIELIGAEKRYMLGGREVRALDAITLSIAGGELVAVTGASGSGKSTLMHLMGCLDRPTAGDYRLNGQSVRALDETALARIRNTQIGFVFQSFCLMPHLSALQNVMHPLSYRGVDERSRERRARAALARVGMEKRCRHHPRQLSGGEQQRVAIARALVGEPSLILADEPTGNLDSVSSARILKLLEDLHGEGQTVIVVTHDATVAARCRRNIVLQDGAIVGDRTASKCAT